MVLYSRVQLQGTLIGCCTYLGVLPRQTLQCSAVQCSAVQCSLSVLVLAVVTFLWSLCLVPLFWVAFGVSV